METIVFNNASAATENYIHQKIQQAEAIWFAGGNQWNYIDYWRDTPIDSLINEALAERNIAIGGTSAGMAILGGFYFSAKNGTVTSAAALSDPYDNRVAVDSTRFLQAEYLSDVITDTHYDNPDRKGRHMAFLARILTDYGVAGRGIACDEYTAVCIDPTGMASVYGEYPDFDDNAYFLQTNCELSDQMPEDCSPGNMLQWNRDGQSVKVYKVKGTLNGSNTFDLNDWQTGTGGVWENWHVTNGTFGEANGSAINCAISATGNFSEALPLRVFPNPTTGLVRLETGGPQIQQVVLSIWKDLEVYSAREPRKFDWSH